MEGIFIGSSRNDVGKTTFALGMGQCLKEMGYNVGYFKPLGRVSTKAENIDDSAVLMKNVLKLDDDLTDICPLFVSDEFFIKYQSLPYY